MSYSFLPCRDAAHVGLCEAWFDHETSASLELSFRERRDAIDSNSQQMLWEYEYIVERDLNVRPEQSILPTFPHTSNHHLMTLFEKFTPKLRHPTRKPRDKSQPLDTERGHPGTVTKLVKGQKLGILAQVRVHGSDEDAQSESEQAQTLADGMEARTIATIREHLAFEREGMCVIPTSQADAESEAIQRLRKEISSCDAYTNGQRTFQEVCTHICKSIQTGGYSDSSVEVEGDLAMIPVDFPAA
jgi:hypothetical protein